MRSNKTRCSRWRRGASLGARRVPLPLGVVGQYSIRALFHVNISKLITAIDVFIFLLPVVVVEISAGILLLDSWSDELGVRVAARSTIGRFQGISSSWDACIMSPVMPPRLSERTPRERTLLYAGDTPHAAHDALLENPRSKSLA